MTRLDFKKLLFAIVGFTALSAVSVQAADLPPRPMPMPRAPVFVPFFSWNGFYLGINAGYAFGNSQWTDTFANVATDNFAVNGAMVGGTAGYNLQFGSAVFGVEGDIGWSGAKGSTLVNCPIACETKNSWFGTARGRIGYAFDRFLPYFTGGGAFGEIKQDGAGITANSKTNFGWVIGGGVEYAFVTNWSAKIEYLYADLGSVECPVASCGTTIDTTLKLNIVRAGLNYKF